MLTNSPDCDFCSIVRSEDTDAREIYRDENVVAFFPTEPAVMGHTLVIPRSHIPDIWSLDESTAKHVAWACTRLAKVIRQAINPEGFNIIQSNGEAATQTVPHFHVHLVPRWIDDAMGPIWPVETNYTESEKDETLLVLRQACRDELASD